MEQVIRYGSIEAGGTKFICAVGDEDFNIIESITFATGTPVQTLDKVRDFFTQNPVSSLGIGSFGPIDINRTSKLYGQVMETSKESWRNANLLKELQSWFGQPIFLTTDVNSSAYGEYSFGKAKQMESCAYVTIGTGIGAGIIQQNQFVGGTTHLEIGHSYVNRHEFDMTFEGVCPYHGANCFEGVAAGPSILQRYGISGEKLPLNHEFWEIEAYYLAQLAYNIRVNFAPEVIIFGGGVVNEMLLDKVRRQFEKINANYIEVSDLENFIVSSYFTNNGSATIGNFALAKRILDEEKREK